MEPMPRVRNEEFTEQFTALLSEHWSEIIQVLKRQAPRIAASLQVSRPAAMKRVNGGWQIQVIIRQGAQPTRTRQSRESEIVAHAIRSWARSKAQLNLPHITVNFEA
jgi:hypothetical protein